MFSITLTRNFRSNSRSPPRPRGTLHPHSSSGEINADEILLCCILLDPIPLLVWVLVGILVCLFLDTQNRLGALVRDINTYRFF